MLVAGSDICKFTAAACDLGFKKALPPPEKDLPGVVNYYGYDPKTQKIIHIHAHYQLVFGHDLTKNYRLPIEAPLLASAVVRHSIPVASPETELIFLVVRMVLKYSTAESIARRALGSYEKFSKTIENEIEHLEAQITAAKFDVALRRHFPMVGRKLFYACRTSLRPEATTLQRIGVKRKLEKSLAAHARQSRFVEPFVRLKRRIAGVVKHNIFKKSSRKRFETGGALIAIVGGDGAGKTTCVREISGWLSKKFHARAVHIGKPPKSALTLAVAAALKASRRMSKIAGNRPSDKRESTPATDFLQQLRWLSTARDRYRLYARACRYAANGGIVVCDRFPLRQIQLMDAPKIARSLVVVPRDSIIYRLIEMEKSYYHRILPPDLLIVLLLDPETAVKRKTDEPAEHVRPRAAELWQVNWQGTGAQLVDASRKMPEVLADLRSLIWKAL